MPAYNYRDDALHEWFCQRLKLNIPRKAVCPYHNAPWEFFSDAFFDRHAQIIGLSCRTGGKSIGVAGLNVAEMALKPRCKIVSLAGNFEQAKRGYEYVRQFITADPALASKLKGPPLLKRTELINGSGLEILTASERSVHSPHVPKLRIDEVDLVSPDIYQGALSIPVSAPGVRATVVMTSTRFKAYGLMYQLVEEAPERGTKVCTWCVREVQERCPYRYNQCPMRQCEDYCDGIGCKRAQGYLKIDDIHAKYMSLDEETWRTQWLVEKPSRFGLVYDQFGPEHLVRDDDLPPFLRVDDLKEPAGVIRYDARVRPSWQQPFDWCAGVDWGYEDPFVCLLAARLGNDDVYVIDELYLQHSSASEVSRAVAQRFPMLVARPNDASWSIEHEAAAMYCDPSDPASARELQMNNMVVLSRPYKNDEGISLIRRFMRPPGGERPKLFIHERCVNLRRELNRYHLKENSDVPTPGDDHGPDALRYLMTGIFMPVGQVMYQTVQWTPADVPIQPELDVDIPGLIDDGPGWLLP